MDKESYVICESHRARIRKKIIICYVCSKRDSCEPNLKKWKNWYKYKK
jgi:hypothetical protein